MQQVERVPAVVLVFLAEAAVPDYPVHKADILAAESLNGAVGAVMDRGV